MSRKLVFRPRIGLNADPDPAISLNAYPDLTPVPGFSITQQIKIYFFFPLFKNSIVFLSYYGTCIGVNTFLKGLSHEIDFKNVDENGQILALLRAAAGF
jgi:hypothetical protein